MVLTPQVAVFLIAQDYKLDLDNPNDLNIAYNHLLNSNEFGSILHNNLEENKVKGVLF